MPDYYPYTGELFYPSGLKVFLDGEDITYYVFGADTITPNLELDKWKDIDLTAFITQPGRHVLAITADTPGKVDARIEISNERD
jgi:hypothetical protein